MSESELPDVKISLVVGGVNESKKALKDVETATKQYYINSAKYAIKSSNDIQRSYDKLYSNLDRQANNHTSKAIQIQSDLVNKQKSLNEKLLNQEKELTRKLLSEYKNRGTGLKESFGRLGQGGRTRNGSGLRVGGGRQNEVAGALGTIFGIGGGAGILGRSVQGASAGFGVGGLAGGAIGGAAALASATVQKAFDVLISGITSGAQAFFGAVTELGGGFSVSNSIAQVHRNDRSAAAIAAGTAFLSPSERISSKQAMNIANTAIKGTEFDQATGLAALSAWQAKTGETKTFIENSKFLTSGASTFGGGDLVGFTQQLANTKSQFTNLSGGDLLRVALGQMQQGQRGSVEFKDQASLATITAAAGTQTGDVAKNILFQTGLAQIAAPGAGGSVDEAATQIRSYNTALSKLAMGKGKYAAGKASLGLKTNANGLIENYDEVLKKVVLMKPGEVPSAISGEVRASSFVQGLRNKVTGSNAEERSASYDKLIGEFTNVTTTMKEFDKATEETTNTVEYQLKAAFNEIKQVIGDQVKPDLVNFSQNFKENIPLIKSAIETLISYFSILGGALADFVNTFITPVLRNKLGISVMEHRQEKSQIEKSLVAAEGQYNSTKDPKVRAAQEKKIYKYREEIRKLDNLITNESNTLVGLAKLEEERNLSPSEKKARDKAAAEDERKKTLRERVANMTDAEKDQIREKVNSMSTTIGPPTADQDAENKQTIELATWIERQEAAAEARAQSEERRKSEIVDELRTINESVKEKQWH